ncbi:MAG: hypothetical protein IH623_15275 [Verrucomicrobia bacterium]|nr:hypothetical protein [Verrucomicrobiota bacterium]
MKTRTSSIWITGFVFLLTGIVVGLAQNEADPVPSAPPATATETEIAIPINVGDRGDASLSKVQLSPWAGEILKLTKAGIEDGVIFSFIDNSGTFNLSAEQIIHLSNQGVSSDIITAMLQHDADVISGVRPLTISSEPAREPLFQISFNHNLTPSQKPLPPANSPAPSDTASSQPATMTKTGGSPESNRNPGQAESVQWELPVIEEPPPIRLADFGPQRTTSPAERSLYPVRQPHPVPVTAPIVIMQVSGPTPNTVVISFTSPAAR